EIPVNWKVGGGISYGVHGGCNSLRVGYGGSATIQGAAPLCDVTVLSNPLEVYELQEFEPAPGNVMTAGIKFPTIKSTLCPVGNGVYTSCTPPDMSPLDHFWLNPEPLVVRVNTRSGRRTFEVKPPNQASAQDLFYAQMEAMAAKIECMAPQTGFLGIPGMYDPRWDIDPPPFLTLMQQLGREQVKVGVVHLEEVRAGFTQAPVAATGAMSLERTRVTIEAFATVDSEYGAFTVPVSFEVAMAFEVEAFEDGELQLLQVSDAVAKVDLLEAIAASGEGKLAREFRDFEGMTFEVPFAEGAISVSASY
ncbi:MAG: hypothetical protein AAFQ82_19275, partial [Myxococcota bacterium]